MSPINNPHPDQRYVEALLQNDAALIREIYERFSAETIRWVGRNGGGAEDARDAFQEALIAVTQRARKRDFELTCSFGAYLFLVVRGKWFNELKKRKQQPVTKEASDGLKDEGEDASRMAEETLLEHQRELLFREKFLLLPDRCRELLTLSWKGARMNEVAELMGVTYAYARKKKSDCIAALMESIQLAPEFLHLTL